MTYAITKRVLDLLVSVVAVVLLSPVLVLVGMRDPRQMAEHEQGIGLIDFVNALEKIPQGRDQAQ